MIAIICHRPYQIFNAINYIMNVNHEMADIYISDEFASASNIADDLRSLGLFRTVYLVKGTIYTRGRARNALNYLKDITFPNRVMNRYLTVNKEIKLGQYTTIIIFGFILFNLAMIHERRRIDALFKVILIEDGLEVYVKRTLKTSFPKRSSLLLRILGLGINWLKIDEIYAYKPYLIKNDYCNNIKQLPPLAMGDKTQVILEQLFQKHHYPYTNFDIIFLSQLHSKVEEKAYKLFTQYFCENKICVKLHPTDKNTHKRYKNTLADHNLWELTVLERNFNEKILVSLNSSALFTPKFIYNKELIVVLLYKLAENYNSGDSANPTLSLFDKLKDSYTDKDRIFQPETWGELEQIIIRLKLQKDGVNSNE